MVYIFDSFLNNIENNDILKTSHHNQKASGCRPKKISRIKIENSWIVYYEIGMYIVIKKKIVALFSRLDLEAVNLLHLNCHCSLIKEHLNLNGCCARIKRWPNLKRRERALTESNRIDTLIKSFPS